VEQDVRQLRQRLRQLRSETADAGTSLQGQLTSHCYTYIYLIKTDAGGDTLWTRVFMGLGQEYCEESSASRRRMAATSSLQHVSVEAGESDAYLIKADSTATPVERTFGGTKNDAGYSVQQNRRRGFCRDRLRQLIRCWLETSISSRRCAGVTSRLRNRRRAYARFDPILTASRIPRRDDGLSAFAIRPSHSPRPCSSTIARALVFGTRNSGFVIPLDLRACVGSLLRASRPRDEHATRASSCSASHL